MQSYRIPYVISAHVPAFAFAVAGVYAALAPVAVSHVFQHVLFVPSSVLLTGLAIFLLGLAWFLRGERVYVRQLQPVAISMLAAVVIPALLATIAAGYALTVFQSTEYTAYIQEALPRRLMNLGLFASLTILILLFLNQDPLRMTRSLLIGYLTGASLLVIGGIWQFLHFSIGYPMPGFETRAFVHSVSQDVLINFRLTSFTDEPSFLVPFLIDGLIIGVLLFTRKSYALYSISAVLVLLLSFSVSGYANLALVGAAAVVLLFSRGWISKRVGLYAALALLLFAVLATLAFPQVVMGLFMPIIGRLDSLFDVMHHSRLYMLVFPFVWLFDYSFVNALFGYGPGGYDFLARTKFLSHQGAVSGTSNNVFVDLLFEHGMIGGMTFAVVFLAVFVYLWKKRSGHFYYSVALVLWLHLGVTSLYRSDFVSPRFWILVAITAGLAEMARRGIFFQAHQDNHTSEKKVETL